MDRRTAMHQVRNRFSATRLKLGAIGLVSAGILAMATQDARALTTSDYPLTPSGGILVAEFAGYENDLRRSYENYFRSASSELSGDLLVNQAMISALVVGDIPGANHMAETLIREGNGSMVALLTQGVSGLFFGNYDAAATSFEMLAKEGTTEFLADWLHAWVNIARGDETKARGLLDNYSDDSNAQPAGLMHVASMFALLGNEDRAIELLDANAPSLNGIRLVESYVRLLLRQGGSNSIAKAQRVSENLRSTTVGKQMLDPLFSAAASGNKVPLLISSVQQGVGEALIELASFLGENRQIESSLAILNLGLLLYPSHEIAQITLAEQYEQLGDTELATEVYMSFQPDFKLYDIAVRRASGLLVADEKYREAGELLDQLSRSIPDRAWIYTEVASLARATENFDDAISAYDKAIALDTEDPADWRLFYFRGSVKYSLGKIDAAISDFMKARKIRPNQPAVLNNLAYGWIDRGTNLKEALSLIEQALAIRPNDPQFVDSLGWAHFRLRNYKEAVGFLERAAALLPLDPIINDHLGDSYWKVGREREAQYQWRRVLDFGDDFDDSAKVRRKLKSGL